MSGQFIIVRSDALEDPELIKSPTTFMTLCAISTMTSQNKGGWCYFKQETIAERLGKSRQALSRDLIKLKELGYIEIQHQSYKGRQSNNLYRLVYDTPYTVQHDVAPMPQHDVAPPAQHDVAPKRPEYLKDKKEKKALTRDEFLREINKAYQAGDFAAFNLTESVVAIQAAACFDHWAADGKYPSGCAMAAFRGWIRRGLADKRIKAEPPETARQEKSEPKKPELPEQNWHEQAKRLVTDAEYRSWFRAVRQDAENHCFIAPSRFHADYLKQHYGNIFNEILPGAAIIHQQQKELVNA